MTSSEQAAPDDGRSTGVAEIVTVPLSPEDAERTAERRLRSDGVDDLWLGLSLAMFGFILVADLPSIRLFPLLFMLGGVSIRRYLRRRLTDPYLGYVKERGEPPNTLTKPMKLSDVGGLQGLAIFLLLAGAAYWLGTHVGIDMSGVLRYRRFGTLIFAGLIAAARVYEGWPLTVRGCWIVGVALATGVFGTWRWSSLSPGLGTVLIGVGAVLFVYGVLALQRVRRLPIAEEPQS
jgi:hypothetical protein